MCASTLEQPGMRRRSDRFLRRHGIFFAAYRCQELARKMLRSVNDLADFSIGATDGDIGQVEGFCFDEERWNVHYIVVNTGGWLHARRVLIAPASVERVDWNTRTIEMALTREEVKNSQRIDRRDRYSWRPRRLETKKQTKNSSVAQVTASEHLRNTRQLGGFGLAARDGAIGHLDDFIIDDESWMIRYLVVDTRNWWPGKKVMLSPHWIKRVSWRKRNIEVELSRKQIKDSPEYDDSSLVDRDYEERLHRHYGQPGYWSG
jgi:uncharacterized protein YrrD